MSRRILSIVVASMAMPAYTTAQVYLDQTIQLVGATAAERQVVGLPNSNDPNATLSAATEQDGLLRNAAPTAGNLWAIDLPALGSAPGAGCHVILRTPTTGAGVVTVALNGTAPLPLRRGTEPVDGASLTEGVMLSLIHDGSGFQILNGRNDRKRDCPSGMVMVNKQFCIETTERPPGDYFEAGLACSGSDRRLCSWAEFYTACLGAGSLGIAGMTDNWEWTNDTSNEDNSARIAGLNGCITAGNWMATGSADQGYRCCSTR